MLYNQLDVLARFSANKHGTVATTVGLSLVVLFGTVAGAIDYGRFTHAKREMKAATDAAAMAAATAADAAVADRIAIARSYFDRNNGGSFGTNPNVSVNINSSAETVSVTANATVSTPFMGVLGIKSLPISTKSTVAASSSSSASGKKLEVSMMIDLTGSMGGIPEWYEKDRRLEARLDRPH